MSPIPGIAANSNEQLAFYAVVAILTLVCPLLLWLGFRQGPVKFFIVVLLIVGAATGCSMIISRAGARLAKFEAASGCDVLASNLTPSDSPCRWVNATIIDLHAVENSSSDSDSGQRSTGYYVSIKTQYKTYDNIGVGSQFFNDSDVGNAVKAEFYHGYVVAMSNHASTERTNDNPTRGMAAAVIVSLGVSAIFVFLVGGFIVMPRKRVTARF